MNQPDWTNLKGGYGKPYDPRPVIDEIRASSLNQAAWKELWDELHHQGDVGEASYAAVPLLVTACSESNRDWNFYGLVSTIETERHRCKNPSLPSWLTDDYRGALAKAKELALQDLSNANDRLLIRSAMAVVAVASGDRKLGAVLQSIDDSDLSELLNDWCSWDQLYRPETE